MHDSHIDADLSYPLSRALKRLLDDVHARDLPATLRQWDPPDTAAASEIECGTVRRLALALLALEHLREPERIRTSDLRFRRTGAPG